MSSHRFQIAAQTGPAREGILYGRAMLLVRVRLFDDAGVVSTDTGEACPQDEVYTDLRPEQARELAGCLLRVADEAERRTLAADYWQQGRRG